MAGFGSQPFGTSPYGIGVPATAAAPGGKVLRDPNTGQATGSRRIDPVTKDYVLDEHGRILGMSNTRQLVLMAVTTAKGSAAMRQLGHEIFRIGRVSPNFERRVDFELRRAVQHLVDRDLIEVVEVQVRLLKAGVALARLRWRDLSTGRDDSYDTTLRTG